MGFSHRQSPKQQQQKSQQNQNLKEDPTNNDLFYEMLFQKTVIW